MRLFKVNTLLFITLALASYNLSANIFMQMVTLIVPFLSLQYSFYKRNWKLSWNSLFISLPLYFGLAVSPSVLVFHPVAVWLAMLVITLLVFSFEKEKPPIKFGISDKYQGIVIYIFAFVLSFWLFSIYPGLTVYLVLIHMSVAMVFLCGKDKRGWYATMYSLPFFFGMILATESFLSSLIWTGILFGFMFILGILLSDSTQGLRNICIRHFWLLHVKAPLVLKYVPSAYDGNSWLLRRALRNLQSVLLEYELYGSGNDDFLDSMSEVLTVEIPVVSENIMSRLECIICVIDVNLESLGGKVNEKELNFCLQELAGAEKFIEVKINDF